MPLNPRTRQVYDEPTWTGYEVMLDVYPDVFAYGILLLPKDLKPGEKRPVVVCQHGLEGTPTDTINVEKRASLQPLLAAARRPRLHRLRAAEPVHRPDTLPADPAQGQPAEAVALQLHRPPAPADARLARNAAERGPEADRLLRPQLRRQDRHARAGHREAVLPVDLLGRLQRVGRQERVGRSRPQLHVDGRVRDVRVRPRATRSTTPRWRT